MILESKPNGIFQVLHMERGHMMVWVEQAARASLQRPYNDQLMTPRQLFNWACSNILEQSSLEHRFQLSRIRILSLVPILDNTVQVKFYSSSDVSRKERIKNEIPPELIAGFVTCLYEQNWWLACVLEVCSANKEVKLTFLHLHSPSSSP